MGCLTYICGKGSYGGHPPLGNCNGFCHVVVYGCGKKARSTIVAKESFPKSEWCSLYDPCADFTFIA